MSSFDSHVWRLAGRLADRIARLEPRNLPIPLDQSAWLSARRLESRLNEMAKRNWPAAGDQVRLQFQYIVSRLQTSLGYLLQQMPPLGRFPGLRQRQVYDELLATRDEFAEFDFDLRQQTLSVTTDSITLEEVFLGRFRIVLNFADLSAKVCYRVVAETPHAAASRSDATHPHVLSERLCEGDAGASLKHALRSGRLCDFFQIINQTLQTYNASSAYDSLDEWDEGTQCHGCGDHISEDEAYCCDDCDATMCAHCSTCCPRCGDTTCDSCVQCCPDCGESSCAACFKEHQANCAAVAQPA